MISKKQFKYLLTYSGIAIVIFITHLLILHYFKIYLYAPNILWVHPFMFAISFLSIITVNIIFKISKHKHIANAYMATSLVKMILSIAFLTPQFLHNSFYKLEYISQFFLIYFIYLIIELFYVYKHSTYS